MRAGWGMAHMLSGACPHDETPAAIAPGICQMRFRGDAGTEATPKLRETWTQPKRDEDLVERATGIEPA